MSDKLYDHITGAQQRLRDMGDGTHAEVFSLPGVIPAACPANTAFDARYYPDVEFQFTAGTVTVTRSLDGTNYVTWPVMDKDFAFASSAATPGIYSTSGSAWLKFSADVTVRAGS